MSIASSSNLTDHSRSPGESGAARFTRPRSRSWAITGILGGITLLLALPPLQYMAAMPGALWLCMTALGFALADRNKRSA